MTISELRRDLNDYLSKTVIRRGDGGLHINVPPSHFEVAKYACTTEEKEFTFYKGQVFFKGYELKSVSGIKEAPVLGLSGMTLR